MANAIGLAEDKAKAVVAWLDGYLADLHVLYVKLHNLHWNLEGVGFFELHKQLEEYYDAAAEQLDEVAERILQLGGRPEASMAGYLKRAELKEMASGPIKSDETLKVLHADFSALISKLRKGISVAQDASDEGTADMLIGMLKDYEKKLWMVKARLS